MGKSISSLDMSVAHTIAFLDDLANTLDAWADESRRYGWSTHQVKRNIEKANDCRRQAAALRRHLAIAA